MEPRKKPRRTPSLCVVFSLTIHILSCVTPLSRIHSLYCYSCVHAHELLLSKYRIFSTTFTTKLNESIPMDISLD